LQAADAVTATKVKKVLFIGIDGCRFDSIEAANTPHLDKLMADGAYSGETKILAPRETKSDTCSGPGWSSLLTGVWSDKHGVLDNDFRQPQLDKFPHFFARLKAAQPQAQTVSLVDWLPLYRFIVTSADVSQVYPPTDDCQFGDGLAARVGAEILAKQDPTATFVYFGQVDEIGHRHGFHPTIKTYTDAIERVDAYIGTLVAAIESRPTYAKEQWLVLVSSDHGGKDKGHGGGHDQPEITNSFVIVSGAAAQRGKLADVTYLVDVPVTALAYLGVTIEPAWQLDGRPIGLKTQ
jgi:predicted AlkP superfamily pyrophosphatase or phosphodiesterase